MTRVADDHGGLRRSIAGRLLFWFLVIALIPCAILTAITARIAATALQNSVRDNLVQIAAGKANELEAYAGERVRDGAAFARGPTFTEAVRKLSAVEDAAALADGGEAFREYFTYIAKAFDYAELLLIDARGRVIFSLGDTIPCGATLGGGTLSSSELAAGFDRARTLLQSDLSGFQPYGKSAVPLAFVTCPVFDEGRVSGVLALGIGTQRVWKILADLTGLGDTGEIVAAELAGNSVLITTPLRHVANAAFRLRSPLNSAQATATQRAAIGERGYGEAVDYRGTEVASAWCYVPSFRWGLVVKQDATEAFGLVRFQRLAVIGLSLATILGVTATASEQQQVIADYGASTSQAVAAVKQISVTSQELVRTMTEVNEMAIHTGRMAEDGRGNLEGMDGTMRQLAESTSSFGSKLAVISERAANINLAVTTITKVADQTNLLSINAAIEAEKAGEYGLGFLVVAREIRRLADQTAVASLDIERMVKEMQYSVSAGVMEMDKFAEQVRTGVREIGEVAAKLAEIISAVQGISGRFGQVTEGMRAQSQGAEQIREAMIRLAEGAARTASSLNDFNGATVHLREAVGDLKEEVSRFTI